MQDQNSFTIARANRQGLGYHIWLGVIIPGFIILYIELFRWMGSQAPLPFLLLYGSVVIAANIGGIIPGLIGSVVASGFIIYAAITSFGPTSLTGGPVQVVLGILFLFSNAFLFGRTRNRNRTLIAQLNDQQYSLEALVNTRESELLRKNRLVTALYHITTHITAPEDTEAIMSMLGEELKQLGLFTILAPYDPENHSFVIKYASFNSRIRKLAENVVGVPLLGFHLTPENWSAYEDIIKNKQPLFQKNLISQATFALKSVSSSMVMQAFTLAGLSEQTAGVYVPLLVEQQVMGLLMLWGDDIQQSDMEVFTIFGSQVAVMIEKNRLLQQAHKNEEQFRDLLESAPDPIVIVDKNGRIILVNQQTEIMFGYPRKELVGELVEILMPEVLHSIHKEHRQKYIVNPHMRTMGKGMVLTGQRKDGTQIPVEISLSPLKTPDGILVTGVMRDVTLRQERERELELLNKVISTGASRYNEQEILRAVCTAIAQYFDVPQVALALLDESHSFETVVAEYLAPKRPSALNVKIPVEGNPAMHAVLTSGKPVAVYDVQSDPLTIPIKDILHERGTQSLLIIPVPIRGQAVGTLGIDSLMPRKFTNREIQLGQVVAEELGRALETTRLYERLRAHTADLEDEIARRTLDIKKANERLQELDKVKSKIVSDVSHELRSPIASLQMYLDLLDRGKNEKRPYYMQVLGSQLNRLQQLVEDILDLSRLEMSKELEIGLESVDINEVIVQVGTLLYPRAEAASLNLIFLPEADLPEIWAERNQLTQIITNLVTNAINYTYSGEVRITASLNSTKTHVVLNVKDTGMGIESEDLDYIFDRFYRGQHTKRVDIPGTGLGLGIVKEIVELHQGYIEVESEVGKGSVFKVYLPTHEMMRQKVDTDVIAGSI
jgi:PAS domain S-box-containing protein